MLIFLALLSVGLLLVLASAVLGHEMEIHPDLEGGLGFLSLRSMAVFLTAFGTVGALMRHNGKTVAVSSLWGLLAGVGMMGLYALAMHLIRSQQASSLITDSELVGATGLVTIAIPAEGVGEVTCHLKSQTTRRTARSLRRQAIPEGERVRIGHVEGDLVLVDREPP